MYLLEKPKNSEINKEFDLMLDKMSQKISHLEIKSKAIKIKESLMKYALRKKNLMKSQEEISKYEYTKSSGGKLEG